ncbi:MAG TPA: hypothetical protein VGS21_05955 [Acidimicrobiales bacterium]|nr:hypothetical protein [Acidimicrobiales bacterium]
MTQVCDGPGLTLLAAEDLVQDCRMRGYREPAWVTPRSGAKVRPVDLAATLVVAAFVDLEARGLLVLSLGQQWSRVFGQFRAGPVWVTPTQRAYTPGALGRLERDLLAGVIGGVDYQQWGGKGIPFQCVTIWRQRSVRGLFRHFTVINAVEEDLVDAGVLPAVTVSKWFRRRYPRASESALLRLAPDIERWSSHWHAWLASRPDIALPLLRDTAIRLVPRN